MNEWILFGLSYDIVGVLVLGYALVIPSDKQLVMLAGTYWGNNPHLLDALVKQRTDAWFGVTLLVCGFIMQAFGAGGSAFPTASWIILPLILVGLCAALVRTRNFAVKRAKRTRDTLKAKMKKNESTEGT